MSGCQGFIRGEREVGMGRKEQSKECVWCQKCSISECININRVVVVFYYGSPNVTIEGNCKGHFFINSYIKIIERSSENYRC